MFVIAENPTFAWPVNVRVPQDGGTWKVQTFQARFKVMSTDGLAEVLKSPDGDRDLSQSVLVGWDQINDASGQAVAFSEEARDALLQVPYVRSAIVAAYLESMAGKKAFVKN